MAKARITGSARRERLLDAAAQIVLELGVAAVTMEAVALRNSVNRAMAYRYFADRDDLLRELIGREHERQASYVAAHVDPSADFEGALRYALQHWYKHGELFLKLANDTGPLAARAAAIRREDAQLWASGLEKTFTLPTDVALRLAAFVVGGSYGVFEQRTSDDAAVIDDLVRSVMAAGRALQDRYASASTSVPAV
jgi:AcrR family transcriptional regulator